MNLNRIHYLTKQALKGDVEKARTILKQLERYRVSAIDTPLYLVVYQIAMNTLDISEECRLCGGVCCKEGGYIPVYQFDIEELRGALGSGVLKYLVKIGGDYYLQRPCPFLKDWLCSIHRVKPYACLSYPFASEEVQSSVLTISSHTYPKPVVPHYCRAGYRVWSIIAGVIDRLTAEKSRTLRPVELLEALLKFRDK